MPPLVSAGLVSMLAVGVRLSTRIHTGYVATMITVGGGSNVIAGGESATRAAGPGAGGRIPVVGVRAGPLGTECCHLE
jgi:hypothetical protein